MEPRTFSGTGPFGPVRAFLPGGAIPDYLLRYLCTSPRDAEGQYGVEATPAMRDASDRRVEKRMAQFRKKFPDLAATAGPAPFPTTGAPHA